MDAYLSHKAFETMHVREGPRKEKNKLPSSHRWVLQHGIKCSHQTVREEEEEEEDPFTLLTGKKLLSGPAEQRQV